MQLTGHDIRERNANVNVIKGGGRGDLISGRGGADQLSGEGGSDTFFGSLAELDGDFILDFVGSDRIVVEGAISDIGQIQLTQEGDHALLQFLNETGSVLSTLALAGHNHRVVEVSNDGIDTAVYIRPVLNSPVLIDFDSGVQIGWSEYVEDGFQFLAKHGIHLFVADSDLELNTDFGNHIEAIDGSQFSVLAFDVGTLDTFNSDSIAFS